MSFGHDAVVVVVAVAVVVIVVVDVGVLLLLRRLVMGLVFLKLLFSTVEQK